MSPSSSTGSSEAALRRPLLNSGLVAQFPALLSSCTGTRPARGCLPCEAPWPHTCYDCWRTASGHLLLGAETRGVEGSRGWPAILSRKWKKGDWSNPSWPDLRSENPKTQQVFQWKLKIFSCWLYTPWPQCCSQFQQNCETFLEYTLPLFVLMSLSSSLNTGAWKNKSRFLLATPYVSSCKMLILWSLCWAVAAIRVLYLQF